MYFKKFVVILLIYNFLYTPCYGVNHFRQGIEAFEAGNLERAKEKLSSLARAGSVIAQAYLEKAETLLGTPVASRFKSKKPFSQMSPEERKYVEPMEQWTEASVAYLTYTGRSHFVAQNKNEAKRKIQFLTQKSTHKGNAWKISAALEGDRSDINPYYEAFLHGEYTVVRHLSERQLAAVTRNQGARFLAILERLEEEQADEASIYYELYGFFQTQNLEDIASRYLKMAAYHGKGDALFSYLEKGYLSSEKEGDLMVQWFAAHGNKRAICIIGYYHEHGVRDFDLNPIKAYGLYSTAAEGEGGYPQAQFNSGICLRKGIGTRRNLEKALQRFRSAVKGGYGDEAVDTMKETLEEAYVTLYSINEDTDLDFSADYEAFLTLARRSEALTDRVEDLGMEGANPSSASTVVVGRENHSPAATKFYREAMEILREIPRSSYTVDTNLMLANLLIVHRQRGTDEEWSYVERFLNSEENSTNQEVLLSLSELYRMGGGSIAPDVSRADAYLLRLIRNGYTKAIARAALLTPPEFRHLGISLEETRKMMIGLGNEDVLFALAMDSQEEENLDDAEGYYRAFLPHDRDGYGHRNLAVTLLTKRGGEYFNEEEISLLQQASERGCVEVFNDLGVDAYRHGEYGKAHSLFIKAQEQGRHKLLHVASARFMLAESREDHAAVEEALMTILENETLRPEQHHEVAVMFLGLTSYTKNMDNVGRALKSLSIASEHGLVDSLALKLQVEQVLWKLIKSATREERTRHVKENGQLLALQGRESSEEDFETLVERSLTSGAFKTLERLLDPKVPSVSKNDLKTLLAQLMRLPGLEEGSMGPSSKGFRGRFGDSVLGIHFKHKPGKDNEEVRGGRKTSAAASVRKALTHVKSTMSTKEVGASASGV